MQHYKLPSLEQPDKDRFWSKVIITANPNECWNWLGYIRPKGYGGFKINRVIYKPHRLSYFLATNHDPESLNVCHKCDNTACVNPNHFFLGTQDDNMKDCMAKKRFTVGEKRKDTKFNDNQVIEIRKLYKTGKVTHRDIAKMYSVTQPTITSMLNGKTWKHIKTA